MPFFLSAGIKRWHLGLGKPRDKNGTLGSGAQEGVRLESYHWSGGDDDNDGNDDYGDGHYGVDATIPGIKAKCASVFRKVGKYVWRVEKAHLRILFFVNTF